MYDKSCCLLKECLYGGLISNCDSTMDIINPAEILNQYQQILASASNTDRVLSEANVTGYKQETPADDPDVIPPSQPEKVTGNYVFNLSN